jgi:hypothetical protein
MSEDSGVTDPVVRRRDRDRRSGLTGGLVLITFGVIFLLDQMRWSYGWRFHELWPVILIVIGLAKLFTGDARGRARSGGWLVLIGVLFLLNTTHVFPLDRSWPVFIVAAGLGLMFGGFRGRRRDNSGGSHV